MVNLRRGAFALAAIVTFAGMDRAHSADWPLDPPPLRGTIAPSFARWDGWQVGYTNMQVSSGNFTNGPAFGGFFPIQHRISCRLNALSPDDPAFWPRIIS